MLCVFAIRSIVACVSKHMKTVGCCPSQIALSLACCTAEPPRVSASTTSSLSASYSSATKVYSLRSELLCQRGCLVRWLMESRTLCTAGACRGEPFLPAGRAYFSVVTWRIHIPGSLNDDVDLGPFRVLRRKVLEGTRGAPAPPQWGSQ